MVRDVLVQYHANQFLPLSDDQVVQKVKNYLSICIPEFGAAEVVDKAVVRFRRAVTHFFPGNESSSSLKSNLRFPSVFQLGGNWQVAPSREGVRGLR